MPLTLIDMITFVAADIASFSHRYDTCQGHLPTLMYSLGRRAGSARTVVVVVRVIVPVEVGAGTNSSAGDCWRELDWAWETVLEWCFLCEFGR